MRFQIRVLHAPRIGTGAFAPIPVVQSTAAFNGQNIVTGSPGVRPVRSPRPAGLKDGELGGPWNQPSDVAPDYILPSIYVAHPNRLMHFPGDIAVTSPNPNPIPAAAIGPSAKRGFRKPVIGGPFVTRAARPFTRWLNYPGSSGSKS